MSIAYIGLDTANTTGIAIWKPHANRAFVGSIKSDPIHQLIFVMDAVTEHVEDISSLVFVMERLHEFRNAISTRSLLERYGYIKFTLKSADLAVEEVSTSPTRSWLGVKTKTQVFDLLSPRFKGAVITNDETDALAIAMYCAHLNGLEPNLDTLEISNL